MRLLQSLLPCFLLVFTWINAGQGLLNSTSVRSIYQTCSMSPMSLQPGCISKISGLQSRSDMNGHEVLVHHFVHNLGRFEVEDVTTGEFVRVKPENLILHDPVMTLHSGPIGNMDTCHTYIQQLVEMACRDGHSLLGKLRTWEPSQVGNHISTWGALVIKGRPLTNKPHCLMPKLFLSVLQAVSAQPSLVSLNLAAVGHFVALELRPTPSGLRGRLLQSWVKSDRDGNSSANKKVRRGPALERRGFTSREWLACDEFGWMDEERLGEFFRGVEDLRSRITDLTNAELLNCARAEGHTTASQQRSWAQRLISNIFARPLTQQPGRIEDVAGYSSSMAASGLPAHFVIYEGPVSAPKQILDFPIEAGLPILSLGRSLFAVNFSAFVWLKAIEFHDHPTGWTFAVMSLKDSFM